MYALLIGEQQTDAVPTAEQEKGDGDQHRNHTPAPHTPDSTHLLSALSTARGANRPIGEAVQ